MSRVQFPVGDVFVEFEGNSGHAPGHPETLTASVRVKTAKGRPGPRQHVSFSVRRSAVLKFALQMLELSDQMLPESLFLDSGVIGASAPLPTVTGIDEEEQRALDRILGKTRPLDVAARAMERLENLRRHMGVLRQVQRYLETCDDSSASNLQILVACAERTGAFPFDLVIDTVEPESRTTAPVADMEAAGIQPLQRCAASSDGECRHAHCQQIRDNEPNASGRHCPIDVASADDWLAKPCKRVER